MSESSRNRAPRLPDFIAVGPPRTATTWLHEVLQGHVCLPADRKETDFFTRFYDRGLDWYADYFRHCEGGIPVGELSPMYLRHRLPASASRATFPMQNNCFVARPGRASLLQLPDVATHRRDQGGF